MQPKILNIYKNKINKNKQNGFKTGGKNAS